MALTIGIACSTTYWKTCLRENARILELRTFPGFSTAFAYLESTCALYPEPTITFPLGRGFPLARLSTVASRLNEQQQQREDVQPILMAIKALSLDSYCLPAIRHLPSVPSHRKLGHLDIGTPGDLCRVVTLIYRMSERQMAWSEMNFFYVDVGRSIVVVENGQIVNGISYATAPCPAEALSVGDVEVRRASELAFWEGLTRDLAGLMAIHHLEDIIVIGQYRDAFVERFAETYQVYLFPRGEPGTDGYEAAIGAALIADGLRQPSLAAEVVERLQIR